MKDFISLSHLVNHLVAHKKSDLALKVIIAAHEMHVLPDDTLNKISKDNGLSLRWYRVVG